MDEAILKELNNRLTTVIHNAWALQRLGIRSFESHHIKGTFNLLSLYLGVETTNPARLFFCSSILAVAGAPLPATILETYTSEQSQAQCIGYARSKLATENIVQAAWIKTGMIARVLRLGQTVGDTQHGLWNTTEAILLMIQSATTIGALPALEETPSWMPVGEVARAVLELSGLHSGSSPSADPQSDISTVHHVQNTCLFHWTHELLPALRAAGLDFEAVPQREWVRRLREGEQDPKKNPTIKLLDFFAEKYDNDKPGRVGLVFMTEKSGEKSEAARKGYDVVRSGLMSKTIESWRGMR